MYTTGKRGSKLRITVGCKILSEYIIVSDPDPDGSGFFADPDPGFKSPDPDPSINKLMGSK